MQFDEDEFEPLLAALLGGKVDFGLDGGEEEGPASRDKFSKRMEAIDREVSLLVGYPGHFELCHNKKDNDNYRNAHL